MTERTHETENRPRILVVFDPDETTPGAEAEEMAYLSHTYERGGTQRK
jgi:hypothetical protein